MDFAHAKDARVLLLLAAAAASLALACGGKTTADGVSEATEVSECHVGAPCTVGQSCTSPGSNDGSGSESLSCATEKAISVTTTSGPHLCPTVEPVMGQFCPADVLVECSYPDTCPAAGPIKNRIYKCASGAWTGSAPSIACPTVRPSDGDSCGACALNYPLQCKYPSTSGCAPVGVFCFGGAWTSLSASECTGPVDAGAD